MIEMATWIYLLVEGFQKNIHYLPQSFILQNNKGVFTDVTAKVCPALQKPGMVTSAVWTDFDNDKQTDLIIAGEWMPIRFFKNNHGKIKGSNRCYRAKAQMNGMWRSLIATDIDNDGDLDFIAGNLGLNCIYKVSVKEPYAVICNRPGWQWKYRP